MVADRTSRLYRTIWRWHFWAGLIVVPFLLVLSATGAIYLFNDEINDALYPELRLVAPSVDRVPVSAMLRAAVTAHPGAVSRIDVPAAADRAAIVFVRPASGPPLRVHVDPHGGRVLGSLRYDRTLVGLADEIHGSLMLGSLGDAIVELSACWALVLIGTGLYLWWPRGRWRAAGTVWPRFTGGGRRLWRDLHGPVGVWTGALIAFLIVTGLPWAAIEGDVIQRATAAAGIGYPPSFRTHNAPASAPVVSAPQADAAGSGAMPWTLSAAPRPRSAPPARHGASAGGHEAHESAAAVAHDPDAIAGTDMIVAQGVRRGIAGGFRLFLPADAAGAYTLLTYPDQPEGQRTLYFDRYSGRPIGDEVRFADYGWAARAIELGVAIHMGNYFGLANQLLMLVPCIGIWLLAISGLMMWWRRRPSGRSGVPPRADGARLRGAVALLAIAALAMPLFGASLAVVAAAEWLAARRAQA